MSETLKTGGEESAENTGNDGPWGEEYQKSVPPFNPEQKAKPQEISPLICLKPSLAQCCSIYSC